MVWVEVPLDSQPHGHASILHDVVAGLVRNVNSQFRVPCYRRHPQLLQHEAPRVVEGLGMAQEGHPLQVSILVVVVDEALGDEVVIHVLQCDAELHDRWCCASAVEALRGLGGVVRVSPLVTLHGLHNVQDGWPASMDIIELLIMTKEWVHHVTVVVDR